MPKVSIIVPVFNHLKYLPERMDSILSQEYQDFEIILLDDASTDGSAEYLQKFQGAERVSAVILNEKNGGSAFKQWEKGFESASGELIWIAESDDVCTPDMLGTLVGEFQKDPSCVLAFSAAMLINSEGEPLGIQRYHRQLGRSFKMSGEKFVRKWLLKNNYVVNASGALFRKSALRGIDARFKDYRGVGDWLFWVCMARQGTVSFVDRPLNLFRQHESNTTASLRASGRDLLELRALLDDFERLGLKDSCIWLRHRLFAIDAARRSGLPSEQKSKVLKAWNANAPISLLAALWMSASSWHRSVQRRIMMFRQKK